MMHDYLALLADSLSSDRNAYEAIGLGANPIWLRNALVPASGTFPGLPLLRVSRNVIRTRSAEASIACQNICLGGSSRRKSNTGSPNNSYLCRPRQSSKE